jgi:hypothetical protein
MWLLGGKQTHPVLLWLIGMFWLQITCDVVFADLTDTVLSDTWLGPYRVEAIRWSLCAALALAIGMRSGTRLGELVFRPAANGDGLLAGNDGVSLSRAVTCYFVSLVAIRILGLIVEVAPLLTQPIVVLSSIKFVCVYVLAAKVFQSDRGYKWLIIVLVVEMVTGLTGFFSSYKEAFIVMFIALASSRRAPNVSRWIIAAASAVALVWASLVWAAVKAEYRYRIADHPVEERVSWMAQRIFGDRQIDYGEAVTHLFERIGYTELYAKVLERQSVGAIPGGFGFYLSAVQHILTPRILFPDKAVLDDSKVTRTLIGLSIAEGTSIGVGFVAQAQVDFGFPGMLLPMLFIGFMVGCAAKYFMTRPAPLIIRHAFTTAALFTSFHFESNIDKALGGFAISCLVFALTLKFGYPVIARWLAGSRAGRNTSSITA